MTFCPKAKRWTITIENERGEAVQWCPGCQEEHKPELASYLEKKDLEERPVIGDWI